MIIPLPIASSGMNLNILSTLVTPRFTPAAWIWPSSCLFAITTCKSNRHLKAYEGSRSPPCLLLLPISHNASSVKSRDYLLLMYSTPPPSVPDAKTCSINGGWMNEVHSAESAHEALVEIRPDGGLSTSPGSHPTVKGSIGKFLPLICFPVTLSYGLALALDPRRNKCTPSSPMGSSFSSLRTVVCLPSCFPLSLFKVPSAYHFGRLLCTPCYLCFLKWEPGIEHSIPEVVLCW